MGLAELRARYQWPAERPDLNEDWFGWLCDTTAKMLADNLSPATQLVVECGSFLGVSARAILLAAPNAHLICVDTWRGSPEHVAADAPAAWSNRIATLHDGFLANLWPWRDRVTPVREDSLVGLATVAAYGLTPDLVYLDSEHSSNRVRRELQIVDALWPTATIVLDDTNNVAVGEWGADKFAAFRKDERSYTTNASAGCFR